MREALSTKDGTVRLPVCTYHGWTQDTYSYGSIVLQLEWMSSRYPSSSFPLLDESGIDGSLLLNVSIMYFASVKITT